MTVPKDPTEPMRLKASRYSGVDEGTACTQSSFKVGKKAFLFIGMQGGRSKAMFKLQKSLPQAEELARESPADYQVGKTAWVTARFTAEKPMPKRIWEKWLDESYALSTAGPAVKKKATTRKTAKKKTKAKKKTARK
ncbi:MAG: MmcQ/YjbR family DNA-binding protein [Planctomycetota bacterium]|jgi:hypothetical protein